MSFSFLLDIFLISGSLTMAWLCLFSHDLLKAITCFVCMGLFVTLMWIRLDAWDVAIAEAAIGAGLTGDLLLSSRRVLKKTKAKKTSAENESGEQDV
jgi:energy-converting hydrogenase B subunit D